MRRAACLVLILHALLDHASRCSAQTRAMPLYGLPPDGTWVEYACKAVGPHQEESTGTLRISSVGREEVQGKPCRWIELRMQWTKGGQTKKRFRKLLVAEKGWTEGGPLLDHVHAAFAREGTDGPVVRLSGRHTEDVFGMGFKGPRAALQIVRARVFVATPAGRFQARLVSARGQEAARQLEYRGWLTPDVPFGWARFEVRQQQGQDQPRLVFRGEAARMGRGAKTEVDQGRHAIPGQKGRTDRVSKNYPDW